MCTEAGLLALRERRMRVRARARARPPAAARRRARAPARVAGRGRERGRRAAHSRRPRRPAAQITHADFKKAKDKARTQLWPAGRLRARGERPLTPSVAGAV